MIDRFTLSPFEFFVLPTRTRFPFRYGIASMTEVPHLFMRTNVTIGSSSSLGLTAEGLPPKWFTKDPGTTFEQDLPQMLEVIRQTASLAEQIAQKPVEFFEFWNELYRQHSQWASTHSVAPLLAQLGVSLVERAVIDGICRIANQPLNRLLATGQLRISLQHIYPELGETQPKQWLPPIPVDKCFIRHTIGLGDSLADSDIPPNERLDDGLPQSLETSIRAYGLRYFKVKLNGSVEKDFPRLRALAQLLKRETADTFWLTLDGNENFKDFETFHEFWNQAIAEPTLREFCNHILVIEQPVHRDHALSDEASATLKRSTNRPPMIIDESDASLGDLRRALQLGYAGTSHKNCKGIVKGIANACLLAKLRQEGQRAVLTGEDLCTLGPVPLMQDLTMMALLGIEHVERNGHHYYRGLSMFPREWQEKILTAHSGLYARHAQNFACLQIQGGQLNLDSINRAPFGVQPLLDPTLFSKL
jgi:hypothetical protein